MALECNSHCMRTNTCHNTATNMASRLQYILLSHIKQQKLKCIANFPPIIVLPTFQVKIITISYNTTHFPFRHSQPASRPTFTDMVVLLQRPDFQLLWWSEEDKMAYSEKARTLGGPVEDGEEMYTELQKTYFELAAN